MARKRKDTRDRRCRQKFNQKARQEVLEFARRINEDGTLPPVTEDTALHIYITVLQRKRELDENMNRAREDEPQEHVSHYRKYARTNFRSLEACMDTIYRHICGLEVNVDDAVVEVKRFMAWYKNSERLSVKDVYKDIQLLFQRREYKQVFPEQKLESLLEEHTNIESPQTNVPSCEMACHQLQPDLYIEGEATGSTTESDYEGVPTQDFISQDGYDECSGRLLEHTPVEKTKFSSHGYPQEVEDGHEHGNEDFRLPISQGTPEGFLPHSPEHNGSVRHIWENIGLSPDMPDSIKSDDAFLEDFEQFHAMCEENTSGVDPTDDDLDGYEMVAHAAVPDDLTNLACTLKEAYKFVLEKLGNGFGPATIALQVQCK